MPSQPEVIVADGAPKPTAGAPYSQAIALDNLVFVSGQLPVNPQTGQLTGDDIRLQTEQVLANLTAVLEAAGSGLDKLLKVTVYLKARSLWADMNEVYASRLGSVRPARTAVVPAEMALGALVEMDAIAWR